MSDAAVDAAALAELTLVQASLAEVTRVVESLERAMPPVVCSWQGTAWQAYASNLEYLRTRFADLSINTDNARAAIVSAIAVATG